MYLFKKIETVLKEQTRVIEDVVVTLKIVKIDTKILCGFLKFTTKKIIPYTTKGTKIPDTYSFRVNLLAAQYDLLAANHELMIDHTND